MGGTSDPGHHQDRSHEGLTLRATRRSSKKKTYTHAMDFDHDAVPRNGNICLRHCARNESGLTMASVYPGRVKRSQSMCVADRGCLTHNTISLLLHSRTSRKVAWKLNHHRRDGRSHKSIRHSTTAECENILILSEEPRRINQLMIPSHPRTSDDFAQHDFLLCFSSFCIACALLCA